MLNVLKMDLYRLRKGHLLRTILVVAAGITLLSVVALQMANYAITILKEYGAAFSNSGTSGTGTLEDAVALLQMSLPSDYVGFMEAFFHGNYTTLFIVIFAILFYGNEYKKGYIKNTITRTRGAKNVFSKLIIILIATVLIYIMVGLLVTIACLLMGIFDASKLPSLCKVFFTGILLNLAVATVTTTTFCLWQKQTPALISGICYVMVGSELLTILSLPIGAATNRGDFDLNKYLCIGNLLIYLTANQPVESYIRMVVLSIVVLIVCTVISVLSSNRKDVS